jgi:hypothetical protein
MDQTPARSRALKNDRGNPFCTVKKKKKHLTFFVWDVKDSPREREKDLCVRVLLSVKMAQYERRKGRGERWNG